MISGTPSTGSRRGSYSGLTHVEHQEQRLPWHKGSIFLSHSPSVSSLLFLLLLLFLSLTVVVREMVWATMEKEVGKDSVKNGKKMAGYRDRNNK